MEAVCGRGLTVNHAAGIRPGSSQGNTLSEAKLAECVFWYRVTAKSVFPECYPAISPSEPCRGYQGNLLDKEKGAGRIIPIGEWQNNKIGGAAQ